MKETIKRSFNFFYYILLSCLVLIALLLVVSIFPITGNFKVKVVESGSMEPAIKTGSIVVVKPVEQYDVNDIITFVNPEKEEKSITHRIVDLEVIEGEKRFVTQGGANNSSDKRSVAKNEIVGEVLLDLPYLGYVVRVAQNPLGFILIIVVPALIIIYDELRKIWQEIKKIKNKKKDKEQDKEIDHLKDEIKNLKK